ncbi:pyridoxal phosphate-dependent aminotransferase [Enterovirga sp. CN4-39]|uniref:pyridoxal phosphate-dependent aminotransferase n=1 Tax=Enterovirga sp. CN4-39 TaxID=3400910 RepID=UPI003BFFB632
MVMVSASPLSSQQPAYKPGLPREQVAERFGIEPAEIAKLGSAENPFGPSPKAQAAIETGKTKIDLYPEWSSRLLREAIGKRFGFDPECVACGAGETEVISLVIRAFSRPGDPILMYEPCFPIYHIFAENEGRVPVYVRMGQDFDLVVDQYIARLNETKPKIAFITNPHSPSGKLMAEADIRRICEAAGDGTLIVLDEAYIHFTETPGGIELTRDHRNLIVLRTFSKAFGLAGLRLGFGIAANKDLITPLMNLKPTWNLGAMQTAGGIAAIEDDEHVARTVKMIVEMRAYVTEQLAGLNSFRMVPGSRSNFFLLEVVDQSLNSTDVFQGLLKRGVIVKDGSDSFRGLGDRYLRVDVSLKKNMDRLVWALKDLSAAQG